MNDSAKQVADVAEKYYDSSEADQFYFNIWGGEDIHVGIYDDINVPPIRDASVRTVEKMADQLQGVTAESEILDIGAGYGGAARYLAKRFGCKVACLNISETQNERNRQFNAEQGLDDKIRVEHGSFEDIPDGDDSFDYVWSQDAILHSGNRRRVLEEVTRVIRPGGEFVFTDPMQADDCPEGVLQPVLDRIHLDTLGSIAFYRENLEDLGYEEVRVIEMTEHLVRHYSSVRKMLQDRYDEMIGISTKEYVDRMIQGLGHWIDAGNSGYLAWGILHFRKK